MINKEDITFFYYEAITESKINLINTFKIKKIVLFFYIIEHLRMRFLEI